MVSHPSSIKADRFMTNPEIPDTKILKTILEPLLEDFQYWFTRSRKLLENEELSFLEPHGQADLLARVLRAEQEVNTTRMMFQALGCQAGVEISVLVPWHKLLTECWQVAMRFRMEQATSTEIPEVT
jgi:Protein of unknown function (DUF2605)